MGIWALTLGYFLAYIPYSGLSKALTSGLLTGGRLIPGCEVLPAAAVSTAFTVLLFITLMGWWQYGEKRLKFGLNLLIPRRETFISGIGFAAIILTTTLAYSFSGVSIILALILMRAGTLIMSPIIDRVFRRRVRWFSWVGLICSLLALVISFSNTHDSQSQLSLAAVLNLAIYLTGYVLRLVSMTAIAKTGEKEVAYRYFVEEQAVAMLALVLVPALIALIGRGEIASELRFGFAHIFSGSFALVSWGIGFFYAALGIFLSFIYLDRRENTFCMPLFSCSSLFSGIVASYLLMWFAHGPTPSPLQLSAAFLIISALLVMSPLHHLPLYIKQLKDAIAERRLVLVKFVGGNTEGVPATSPPPVENFITINFSAVRDILRKRPVPR